MGWPKKWASLEPISYIEYKKWLRGFNEEKNGLETVCSMRKGNDQKEVQWEVGGQVCMAASEVLLSFLCEQKGAYIEIGMALAGKKISEGSLRMLWDNFQIAGSPPGRELQEYGREELADLMRVVSSICPSYGREAWQSGTWEAATPRVATGVANRVDRLKAIGNGQVPICAAMAFKILRARVKE